LEGAEGAEGAETGKNRRDAESAEDDAEKGGLVVLTSVIVLIFCGRFLSSRLRVREFKLWPVQLN